MSELIGVLAFLDDLYWRFVKWTLYVTSPSYRKLQEDIAELRRERRRLYLQRDAIDEKYRVEMMRFTHRPKPFHFPLPEHMRTGAAS